MFAAFTVWSSVAIQTAGQSNVVLMIALQDVRKSIEDE
jgi:hypothetical protein